MADRSGHDGVSALLYLMAGFVLFFAVAMATILLSSLVSGGWSIAVAILVFLVSTGFALQIFNRLRRWRVDGSYRFSFPSYRGVRYPAFHLVSTEVDGQIRTFGEPLGTNALAESEEGLFILAAGRSDRPHEIVGGKILRHQTSGRELVIPREALRSIDVFEFTDEAIKAAAVDHRSYAERLAGAGVGMLFGVSTKRKIVPFAAFVVLSAIREGPHGQSLERLTFAIPTEIDHETMRFMGLAEGAGNNELVDAAIRYGVNKAQGALVDEGKDQVRDLVGDMPVDVADDIVDLKQDIDFWLNPGAAKIATTDGARGRAMARIVAERVRQWSGLGQVYVTSLAR
jgi:hypothetical protein